MPGEGSQWPALFFFYFRLHTGFTQCRGEARATSVSCSRVLFLFRTSVRSLSQKLKINQRTDMRGGVVSVASAATVLYLLCVQFVHWFSLDFNRFQAAHQILSLSSVLVADSDSVRSGSDGNIRPERHSIYLGSFFLFFSPSLTCLQRQIRN